VQTVFREIDFIIMFICSCSTSLKRLCVMVYYGIACRSVQQAGFYLSM